MFDLRPYQQQGINDLRAAMAMPRSAQFPHGRRILYCLPTGGGKTVVFSEILRSAAAKGSRVLVLAHRIELVQQAVRKLTEEAEVLPAQLTAGAPTPWEPVVVASIPTIVNRLHHMPYDRFDLVIVDEAHHACAGTWTRVIDHFHCPVLGVSATPERLDGEPLKDVFEQLVLGPRPHELVAQGYLSDARVYSVPAPEINHVKQVRGDFDMTQAASIYMDGRDTTKLQSEVLKHYWRHLADVGMGTAVVFCCTVDHADAAAQMFADRGIPAASIDGTTPAADRADRIQQLAEGRIKILTNCQVLTEGVDIPSVAGAILLRPTSSVAMYLQMVGRALRPTEDKTHAIILDHAGNADRLGHPLTPYPWSLEGRKKAGGDAPERDGEAQQKPEKSSQEVELQEMRFDPAHDPTPYKHLPYRRKKALIDEAARMSLAAAQKMAMQCGYKRGCGWYAWAEAQRAAAQ